MNEEPLGALAHDIELARGAAPSWTLARQQQVIWGVRGKLQAKRRRSSTLGVALAAAAGIVLGVGAYRVYSSAPSEFEASSGVAERWDLRDGSRVTIPASSTVLKKTVESETELVFELEAGTASFDVAKKPTRTFKVHSGDVVVRVVGTAFEVTRIGKRSRVLVERGSVNVSWSGGARTLTGGDSGVFPPEEEVKVTSVPDPSAPATAKPEAPAPAPEETGPGALFTSADAARKAGRYDQAVSYLKAITDRYPTDARAPLAAFTRGRVLLESLRRPGEAAAAFAQARSLTRAQSALAEDALAREVDAHRAAGSLGLARERAELYRRNYPKGLRLNQVLRSGGLQDAP